MEHEKNVKNEQNASALRQEERLCCLQLVRLLEMMLMVC